MFGQRSQSVGVGLVALVVLSSTVVAVSGYSLTGSDAIETPTRTVTYEGNDYTINAISRISTTGSITITADVPDDEAYFLTLRGPDNEIITREGMNGDSSHTFSYFGSAEAGTYAPTIQIDGETLAVYPVILAGYDISVTPPSDVTAGSEATIEADVTELNVDKHSSLDRVEVVVGNDDVQVQQTMSQVDGETYSTTIDTDNIESDTYNVYVVVRGDETVRQRDEILGISDTVDLTVTSKNSDGTETGDGTSDQSGTTTATPTETVTESSTENGTETATESLTETDTPVSTTTGTPTETGTENNNVLEPTTPTETATSTADGSGFTALIGIVAIVLGIGIASRQ